MTDLQPSNSNQVRQHPSSSGGRSSGSGQPETPKDASKEARKETPKEPQKEVPKEDSTVFAWEQCAGLLLGILEGEASFGGGTASRSGVVNHLQVRQYNVTAVGAVDARASVPMVDTLLIPFKTHSDAERRK